MWYIYYMFMIGIEIMAQVKVVLLKQVQTNKGMLKEENENILIWYGFPAAGEDHNIINEKGKPS